MELYARVRRAVHVEGKSQREVAREFGLARKTVRKMLEYSCRPGISGRSRCGGPSWGRGRRDRRHSGRRQEPAEEAAAHRQADLRAAEGKSTATRAATRS